MRAAGNPPAARPAVPCPPRMGGTAGRPIRNTRPNWGLNRSTPVLSCRDGRTRPRCGRGRGERRWNRRPGRKRRTAEGQYPPLSFGKPRETGGRKVMGAKPALGAGRSARLLKKGKPREIAGRKAMGAKPARRRRQASPAADQMFSKPLETMGRKVLEAAASEGFAQTLRRYASPTAT